MQPAGPQFTHASPPQFIVRLNDSAVDNIRLLHAPIGFRGTGTNVISVFACRMLVMHLPGVSLIMTVSQVLQSG